MVYFAICNLGILLDRTENCKKKLLLESFKVFDVFILPSLYTL